MAEIEPRTIEGEGGEILATSAPNVYRCFLFTDIEGSTALWEQYGQHFRAALDLHHSTIRSVIARFGGRELIEAGDGFLISFHEALQAVRCATAMQETLREARFPVVGEPLRVRMGIHGGEVEPRENGEFRGAVLNRASRVRDAAHGGQIVCSEDVARVLNGDIRPRELGRYRLKGIPAPERLFQVEWPGMGDESFPPPNARPAYVHNLPQFPTAFIGRTRQIAEIAELMMAGTGGRLVTITGPGGTGKTRVSVAVGERLLDQFSHAVFFVQLADVTDPAGIPREILHALGLTADPAREPEQQIAAFFEGENALLILDNFEQLAETGSLVLQRLIGAVPKLRLLVTSRNRINLLGEREYPLAPLGVPESGAGVEELREVESVQLFVNRAQLARAAFELHERNAEPIGDLCRRLDGVPLAIELAAARADVASPQEILQSLASRLDSLEATAWSVPARHRTLRAAIDWSFGFLPPALKDFFTALTVFRGGWTAEAAEAVAATPALGDVSANILRALSELRAASLITSEESGETMRFRMLETLRQYGEERFHGRADRDRVLRAYREYYLKFAETYGVAPMILGPDQGKYLAMFDAEHDNFRHLLSEPASDDSGIRIAARLGVFWHTQGLCAEGQEMIARQMSVPVEVGLLERLDIVNTAAIMAFFLGDYGMARDRYRDGLGIARELGDRKQIAGMLINLGSAAMRQKDWNEAEACLKEALEILEELGTEPYRYASALHIMALILLERAMPREAEPFLRRAEEYVATDGDLNFCVAVKSARATVEKLNGNLIGADHRQREILDLAVRNGLTSSIPAAFDALAEVNELWGRTEEAVRFLSAGFYVAGKLSFGFWEKDVDARVRHRLEAALAPERFRALWQEGQTLGARTLKEAQSVNKR
jgi:predicted ATPase/class 3 adenylate cyclase